MALDIVAKHCNTPTNPKPATMHALDITAKHYDAPTDPKPATIHSPGHNIQGMVLDTITKHLRRPYQSKISNIAWLDTELPKPVTPLTTSELNWTRLILQPLTFNTAEYIYIYSSTSSMR